MKAFRRKKRFMLRAHGHMWTFSSITRQLKKPVLVIEVDGYHYHNLLERKKKDSWKNHILEVNKIPYHRFSTRGCSERETIIERLKKEDGLFCKKYMEVNCNWHLNYNFRIKNWRMWWNKGAVLHHGFGNIKGCLAASLCIASRKHWGCLPDGGARGEGFALNELPHPCCVWNLTAKVWFFFEIAIASVYEDWQYIAW